MVCLVLPFSMQAQAKYGRDDVRALFPNNIKNLWINNLTGTLDHKHWVDMIIGTDGKTCKGLYTMHNSGETFFFEGDDLNNELKLVELSPEFRATGFISGHYDGENFNGQWMNLDKTMYLTFELNNSRQSPIIENNTCINRCWYRIYSGKIENTLTRLMLIKENNAFKISCYMDSIILKDLIPTKNKQTELLNPSFTSGSWGNKSILIDTSELNQIKIVESVDGDFKLWSILKATDGLNFECFEYADYHSRLIIQKPVTSSKKFNKWIESKMTGWMSDNIDYLKDIKRDQIATKDRWIQFAEGWVEIDLFTGDYISGTIYLQTSLKNGTKKIPFIYDLRWGKELKLQDLFNKDFDAKDYFKHFLPAKIKEMTWKPDVRKWVDNQHFEFITLKDTGISFKTELNSIYGEKEILVPYRDVEQNLRNTNWLKGLIKN